MVATSPRAAEAASSDTELVERALLRDEQAYAAIYRRHSAYLAGVVTRMLGRDSDLDDIIQETFVEGLRQLGGLREPTKLRSFLVTIAVRRIHARLSLRYRLRVLSTQLFGISPAVSDPAVKDDVHALYAVLGRAAAKHRIAWVLHRIEGYTLPEVAEQTGASLATVKRWIAEIDSLVEMTDVAR